MALLRDLGATGEGPGHGSFSWQRGQVHRATPQVHHSPDQHTHFQGSTTLGGKSCAQPTREGLAHSLRWPQTPTLTQPQPPHHGPGTPGCTRPLPSCPHLSLTDWERSPGLGCSSRFLGQLHQGCLQRGKWLPLLVKSVFSMESTVFHQSFPVSRHVT